MAVTPINPNCAVFLDSQRLSDVRDDHDPTALSGLVPLSPISITWGPEHPWDDLEPSVLSMRFLDADHAYSGNQRALTGRRLTVRPDYANPFPAFAMFDGFISSVSAEETDRGSILTVKASSRLLNLLRDKRQGPANGLSPAYQNKGYQWLASDFYGAVSQRLIDAGYTGSTIASAMYGAPRPAADPISVFDILRDSRTTSGATSGTYQLNVDMCMFDDYRDTNMKVVPWVFVSRMMQTRLLVCTGSRLLVQRGTEYTDHRDSIGIIRAKYLALPDTTELSASDQYTAVQVSYYHRTYTNASATDAQRQTEATYWTYSKDGQRTVSVPNAVTDAPNILSLDLNWCEYSDAPSQVANIDFSPALKSLSEYNARTKLPELTLYGDAPVHQMHLDSLPHVIQILGSKFEADYPATHGSWLILGGEITYDSKRRKSPWAHRLRLFPVPPNPSAPAPPTCRDWRVQIDGNIDYTSADWDFGACRYIDIISPNNIDGA